MLDWLTTFIANDWTQRIATFIGGIAVIWGVVAYFYQKFFKVPTEDTKHNRFKGFSFPRRYNQHVIYEHRMFNVRGLRTQGTFTLQLEKVFVELRIAHSNPQQIPVNPVFAKEFTESYPIWDFLKFKSDDTLVLGIIGAPGCGKTTLLQHIALIFASKQSRRYKMPAKIPLLLFLRQHVQKITAEKPINLADLAQAHFTSKDIEPPAGWFANQLNNGQCLVLLDGLDEVANLAQRQKVSEWVDEQVVKYPHCQFVITSRPQGYLTAPVERANVLEVQPFNAEQVKKFIHAWYLENEFISFGHKMDDGIRRQARDAADDLIQRLRGLPALSDLTVNPLLLTMIAMVHRYRGQLPGRRVELYAEICDVLLGHWRQARGIEYRLTAAQKRVALQPLAAYMMQHNKRDIRLEESIKAIIAKPLRSVSNETVEDFLTDVQESSGLFLETEIGEWRFAHLTFQEYLAACHFLQQKQPLDWSVDDSWWHETLRLYVAQGDATLLVQACLRSNTVVALMLAADCLEEALILDATVRQQLETRLINDLESEDADRRKLAAEVRLRRRLNNLQRIDEHREIDLEFITCAEYQLFLNYERKQGRYYQPDHWTDYKFPKGVAQEPVSGVRAEDAEAFCQWLSQNGEYRLPTKSEVIEYSTDNLGTWCQEGNVVSIYGFSMQGVKKDKKDLILQELRLVSTDIPLLLDFKSDFTPEIRYISSDIIVRAIICSLKLNLHLYEFYFDLSPFAHELSRKDIIDDTIFAIAYHRLCELAHAIDENTYIAIKEKDYWTVRHVIYSMQTESDLYKQRQGNLLDGLLAIITATTSLKVRQAWLQYLVKLTEYIWIGFDKLEREEHPTWWQCLWQYLSRPRYHYNQWRKSYSYTQEKQHILKVHWWLQITILREQGKLPAWEGIRIVREKKL